MDGPLCASPSISPRGAGLRPRFGCLEHVCSHCRGDLCFHFSLGLFGDPRHGPTRFHGSGCDTFSAGSWAPSCGLCSGLGTVGSWVRGARGAGGRAWGPAGLAATSWRRQVTFLDRPLPWQVRKRVLGSVPAWSCWTRRPTFCARHVTSDGTGFPARRRGGAGAGAAGTAGCPQPASGSPAADAVGYPRRARKVGLPLAPQQPPARPVSRGARPHAGG